MRRAYEVINRSESVDAAMAGLEEFLHPEIEYVNPEDAIEGGTRKGLAGMRMALVNLYEGAGSTATLELEHRSKRSSSERARQAAAWWLRHRMTSEERRQALFYRARILHLEEMPNAGNR